MKATLLVDRRIVLKDQKYVAIIKVFEVDNREKFPNGIKAKFVLQDIEYGYARLLVDNHEPYGFHMHTRLPDDHEHREELVVKDFNEALEIFFAESERILKNE